MWAVAWGIAQAAPVSAELLEALRASGASPQVAESGELTGLGGIGRNADRRLDDARWAEVVALGTLESADGRIGSADLAWLGRAKGLKRLSVGGGGEFEEGALAALAGLPRLRELKLHHLSLTGAGLGALAGHPELEKLNITNCKAFKGAALAEVAKLPVVRELELYAVRVAGDEWAGLAGHKRLATVRTFMDARSLDGFLAAAATWPELTEIALLFPPPEPITLTDAQADALARLPKLERLLLQNLRPTKAQAARLTAKNPSLKLTMTRIVKYHGGSQPLEPAEK